MADLAAQHAPLAAELRATFDRVVASGRFVLGPEVEAFESEVAALHGLPFAVGVSSGTDALLAALMALGVGPGDRVLTTPFSFFATAAVIARVGAVPVFADIDDDLLIDPAEAARKAGGTKAAIVVDLFGRIAKLPALGVPVIEDAAQAVGARGLCAAAACACLSFFPTKNLGSLGDAGMILTADGKLAATLRALRVQGQTRKYEHVAIGGNFRIDALHAALLRVKLARLAAWNARRRAIAERYGEALSGTPLKLPRFSDGDIVHQYVARAPEADRDRLRAHLKDRGVETDVYYPVPMNRQAPFAHLGQSCPNAERAAREVIALPVHAELTDEQVAWVIEGVRGFHGGTGTGSGTGPGSGG